MVSEDALDVVDGDLKHFLLVYNRRDGVLERQEDFGSDSSAAIAAYEELERKYLWDRNYDVLLVGSDSIETVKITHPGYFIEGKPDVETYLRDALAKQGIPVPDSSPV